MKRKAIIFGLLLATLLLGGCGRNMESDGGTSSKNMNNTAESSPITDMSTTPETTLINDSNNTASTQTENATRLTEQEAKQIALEKVPGATEDDIKKFRLDRNDTVAEYEGEIHYGGMEYEFEIHAYDGTILEWDEDPIKEMVR